MAHTAKIFMNGRSQAVRLPSEYRFESKEVFVRRDPLSGDVILSRRPPTWDGFFEALEHVEIPVGFLGAEERNQGIENRDPLDGVEE